MLLSYIKNIWQIIGHFTKNENWGNPDKVNGFLILFLELIRVEANDVMCIHNAYETSGHSENSQHYVGNACDFHFQNLTLFQGYTIIKRVAKRLQVWEHIGLGLYPDWNTPGFHIDLRGRKARWSRIKTDGEEKYVSLDIGLDRAKKKGV